MKCLKLSLRLIPRNTLKFQDKPILRTGQKSALQHSLFWRYVIFSKLMRTIHLSMTITFQCEYCQCFTFKRCDKFKLKCKKISNEKYRYGLWKTVSKHLNLFPEKKSLLFAACFLLFCYYLLSNYSSFTDKYHDLSLTIFNCYKKQTDQTSHEEVDINTTNNPSDDKHNGGEVKIPSVLFDLACEELKPIREALCSFLFNLFLILSFLLLANPTRFRC